MLASPLLDWTLPGRLVSLATASCFGVVRNSEIRRESELDVDVEGEENYTVQAQVFPRMSGLTLTATAVVGCGASVIGTPPIISGGCYRHGAGDCGCLCCNCRV